MTVPALVSAACPGNNARWCSRLAGHSHTFHTRWHAAGPAGRWSHRRDTTELQHEEALDVDVENLLAKAADNFSVRRAFGTAYEKDGMLIIPVAIVAGGGGGGTGRNRRGTPAAGPGSAHEEAAAAHDIAPQDSGRTEEGGGFGGLVLPSGAYVVKGDQVRWVPAVDVTIAVLASLSLVRMLARTWTRSRRRHGER
jgi:uncharacterized spore protein YtfJ